jgi:hypothetical protein
MNRRTALLLLVTVVILIVAVVFLAKGRSTSNASPKPTATPRGVSAAQRRATRDHAELVAYAQQVQQVLQQSAQIMDQTAAGAATARNRSQLDSVCSKYGPRIVALEDEAAGIAFPRGGTPARKFRHQIIGVYHLYLGATIEGHTAFETGDAGGAADAVADLARSARQIHKAEATAISLINEKKSA